MDPVRPAQAPADVACDDPVAGPPPPTPDEIARVVRALADATRDAFVSGQVPQPGDCDYFADGASHDFDRCLTDDVSNSALFSKEIGDVDSVVPSDVSQNRIGDCTLMATLCALASTPEGRTLIKGAIVENKNDEGHVTSYTVTLHERENHWFRAPTFSDVKVTVSPRLAVGHAQPRIEGATHEVWHEVIEKACAQYVGGYNILHKGSHADVAMELLTGKPATFVQLVDYGTEQLKADLAAGRLVVFETKKGFSAVDSPHLFETHAYCVTGTEVVNGQLCVTMRNPVANPQPPPIPYSSLGQWFARAYVGRTR